MNADIYVNGHRTAIVIVEDAMMCTELSYPIVYIDTAEYF